MACAVKKPRQPCLSICALDWVQESRQPERWRVSLLINVSVLQLILSGKPRSLPDVPLSRQTVSIREDTSNGNPAETIMQSSSYWDPDTHIGACQRL